MKTIQYYWNRFFCEHDWVLMESYNGLNMHKMRCDKCKIWVQSAGPRTVRLNPRVTKDTVYFTLSHKTWEWEPEDPLPLDQESKK